MANVNRDILNTVQHLGGCGIIYCQKKATCLTLTILLTNNGVPCSGKSFREAPKLYVAYNVQLIAYHASLDQKTRNEIKELWKNERIPLIVSTIAFGMGIDVR